MTSWMQPFHFILHPNSYCFAIKVAPANKVNLFTFNELHWQVIRANWTWFTSTTLSDHVWSIVLFLSISFSDTAAELGVLDELACYTQFSGKPTADQLYELGRTLIDLMLEVPHPDGKTLIFSSAAVDIFIMIKLKIGPVMVRQTSQFTVPSEKHHSEFCWKHSVPSRTQSLGMTSLLATSKYCLPHINTVKRWSALPCTVLSRLKNWSR